MTFQKKCDIIIRNELKYMLFLVDTFQNLSAMENPTTFTF